ncbi:LysR family transcriptional regulator [Marinicellulosiphila megalodicopiae]|uniref:LysR family transcriptional regulator n=1 Tax=Marinicellulosiphila megalodicopiae TaxID=2724896 RepID=UPI003BB10F97
MNIQSLQLFIDVATLGSFADAARKLNEDPSKVSRNIAALESELSVQLFKRSTRSLSLTEAGQRYLLHITPIVEALSFANEDAKSVVNRPSGTLKISASTAFGQECLLPHIQSFMQLYPDIHIEMLLSDVNLNLHNEDIDLTFRLTPSFESDLIGTRLHATKYHLCASTDYIKSHLSISSPKDLQHHHCLVFALPKYRSRWLFKNEANELSQIKIQSKLAISSALALKQSAINGLGPAILPDWLIREELKTGQLKIILPQYQVTATDFDTAVWMLYPSKRFLPQKTRVFIDYIKNIF